MVGKVLTDELTYSLNGQNAPLRNARQPGGAGAHTREAPPAVRRPLLPADWWTSPSAPIAAARSGFPPATAAFWASVPATAGYPWQAWLPSRGVSMSPDGLPGTPMCSPP